MDEMLKKQDVLDTLMDKIRELEKKDTKADVILGLAAAMSTVKQMQAAPVTTEKVGHWIYDDVCREHGHCSECGYESIDLVDGKPHNYCSNCGSKMQEAEE